MGKTKDKSKKQRGCWWRVMQGGVLLIVLAVLAAWLGWFLPFWGIPFNASRHGILPITPPWALECWLWEDDVNTAEAVMELVNGYEEHDFPVRTILIDSPWSQRYNDFRLDEDRYPKAFFEELNARDYRVVLWMTSLVDKENKDTAVKDSTAWYEEALSKGYLAGDGAITKWWKGKGGYIDYSNPEAMQWWRDLQQPVFDLGIDGWKLDGAATMFATWKGKIPVPYMKTHAGLMSTRTYMDHYYRDEYQHGLTQNPEFITLVRSLDRNVHREGFAPFDAAPVCWVGDQDHTWTEEEEGIEEALEDILKSAELGYSVVGSDVGGYGGSTIPEELYIRWAQFSTFCGLFLNGGHGERALWKRSNPELQIIRQYSWLHTELVPYIYSYVVDTHYGAPPIMQRYGEGFDYYFGDMFFIAPIHENTSTRTVALPPGRWRYLFEESTVLEGNTEFTRSYPLEEFPAFIRDGAIIPMNVSRAYTGFGDADSEGFLTLALYPTENNAFTLHHPEGGMMEIEVAVSDTITVSLSGTPKKHLLRVVLDAAPGTVLQDGKEVPWQYDAERSVLWIRCEEKMNAQYSIQPG